MEINILRDWAMCCRGMESCIAPFRKRLSGKKRKRKEARHKRERREEPNPLEVELDLSGKFTRKNTPMRRLGNENESHIVLVNGFKQREGLKTHIQLPGYDSQCYDLGAGGVLSQIPIKFMQISISHRGER